MLFGTKSEKVLRQIDQLQLQLEELQAADACEETRAASAERPVAARPFRRPLPEHLPREVHTHMPDDDACPECSGQLSELGEDVAEMLEYVPACFKVLRHVRPKLSCDACDRIVQAPAPSRPIERGLTGPGLLAHVWYRSMRTTNRSIDSRRSMPRRRRSRSLDAGRMGWRDQRTSDAAGRSCTGLRSIRQQAARRRYSGSGARTRQRSNQDRKTLDLCPR